MPPAIDITPRKSNVPVSIVIGSAPSVTTEPINITANPMAAMEAMIRPAHLRGLIRVEWRLPKSISSLCELKSRLVNVAKINYWAPGVNR